VISKPEAEEEADAKKGENEAHKKPYHYFVYNSNNIVSIQSSTKSN
jgi:hypothetical protein